MNAGTSSKRGGTGPSRRRYSQRRTKPWPKALWTSLPNALRPRTNMSSRSELYCRKCGCKYTGETGLLDASVSDGKHVVCAKPGCGGELTKWKPRKRIRSVSVKHMASLVEYAKVKTDWLKYIKHAVTADGKVVAHCDRCEQWREVDVHHIRGRRGPLLTATSYWLLVCRPCHDWIHANPAAAREQNLLAKPGEWGKL